MESSTLFKELTRREFIKTAGLATGVALTTGTHLTTSPNIAVPAIVKGTKLHLLQWNSFVPEADDELRQQLAEWGKQMGAQVTFETVKPSELQPRILLAIESQSGPDIIQMWHAWPHLYAEACVEVDDLAEEVGKTFGGFYEQAKRNSFVNGQWRAVPHNLIGVT
ncbi:MAG: extracellular solute-binding protein, partial [Nitrospira sp.]|nr:extracellular solute-binding protein [Nitrospira sp.]